MARIQINLILSSQRVGASAVMTTQWAVSALPTPAAMATALASARAALVASTAFKAGISSTYSLVSLKALGYDPVGGPAVWAVDASGSAVAGTGVNLTPPLCLVVSEQTGAAGPSFRGRTYWPGCGATAPDVQGNLNATQQQVVRTAWLAMHSTLVTALSTLGGTPVHVVYSPKTGNMTPIVNIRTGNRIDTARGRFGDSPETYITETVPGVVALSGEPIGDEVGLEAIGLPSDATDEEIQARLDEIAKSVPLANMTLGPLKELLAGAATKFKKAPPPP